MSTGVALADWGVSGSQLKRQSFAYTAVRAELNTLKKWNDSANNSVNMHFAKWESSTASGSLNNFLIVGRIDTKMGRTNSIKFDVIKGSGLKLILSKRIELKTIFDNGEYVLENPELNIFLSAATLEEIKEEFESDFIFLWKEYAESDDKDMTLDAIDLKHLLTSLVKEAIDE
ncbi:hypothetical protein [Dehalobacterium formicoaceticum]|uniref:hypothetical protein n=1 Tax=Dehalobacterium formicoaceticum TaxID=51515 RepID=UPI0031F69B5F